MATCLSTYPSVDGWDMERRIGSILGSFVPCCLQRTQCDPYLHTLEIPGVGLGLPGT